MVPGFPLVGPLRNWFKPEPPGATSDTREQCFWRNSAIFEPVGNRDALQAVLKLRPTPSILSGLLAACDEAVEHRIPRFPVDFDNLKWPTSILRNGPPL